MALAGFECGLRLNALLLAVLIGAGTVAFGKGWMGGGDVKLMAAVGLWCHLNAALTLISGIFISGGVLAWIVLGARSFAPAAASVRSVVLKPGGGIPYGVAI